MTSADCPIPTHDHRLSAKNKKYRYSTNLWVAFDGSNRSVIAAGHPLSWQSR
ncbi:hypothetical protein AB0C01_07125 [Micromonospora sp. NPDC048905]|uniref:hypothetical protein n=1 Tax=Micromonospora sp. NPDC048905 TaxID=3155494 RepID=UPI0033CA8FF8